MSQKVDLWYNKRPTVGWLMPQPAQKPSGEAYTGVLNPLTDADKDFFQRTYGIIVPDRKIFRGEGDRYAMPIFPPGSVVARGHVLRMPWPKSPLYSAQDWAGRRKALTYSAGPGPIQSFYTAHGAEKWPALVLVEDQLSAIKLAEVGVASVALLGTPNKGEIGMDRLTELSRFKAKEVVVALDADATEEAFAFARKWGSAFKKLRVAILSKDIKDTPKSDIFGVLGL